MIFLLAYLLRFNLENRAFNLNLAVHHALLTVTIYALASLVFRSYSGLIRHTTVEDILNVFFSTSSAFLVLLCTSLLGRKVFSDGNLIIPVSILIIHYVSITVCLVIVRVAIKLLYQMMTASSEKKKRVLVYGAGAMGVIVKRAIKSDIKGIFEIAGFLDDNKKLQGKKLDGIPICNPKILKCKRQLTM